MKKPRNSSLECLRIICMFGIVSMHLFGIFYNTATGINLIIGNVINSIFNMGVSIFMLISGYFGIRFSSRKLVRLESIILFYSILGVILQGTLQNTWSLKNIIKAFFPISTKCYWYMSVYIIIFVFSDFINKAVQKLEKRDFFKLICLMLFFFSVMPTFIYFEIMEDRGKGLMNMLLMYLIGRYIKIYNIKIPDKLCGGGVCVAVTITCVLNHIATVLHGGAGVYVPFARDNSLTIIAGSIFVFLLFKDTVFYSKIVNKIAEGMFAVYLSEKNVRLILGELIPLEKYASVWYLILLILFYAVVIMIICLAMEAVRKTVYQLFEDKLYQVVMDVWHRVFMNQYQKLVRWLNE